MMFPRFHGGHADEESEVRRRLVFSISLCERPAYQWMKISVTSVTSNVLLAKLTLPGPPIRGPEQISGCEDPPRRRHAGELRERRPGELRERQTLMRLEPSGDTKAITFERQVRSHSTDAPHQPNLAGVAVAGELCAVATHDM